MFFLAEFNKHHSGNLAGLQLPSSSTCVWQLFSRLAALRHSDALRRHVRWCTGGSASIWQLAELGSPSRA